MNRININQPNQRYIKKQRANSKKNLCKETMVSEKPTTLKDIKFKEGIAYINGKTFSGSVEDTLKSGDKIILEYLDGIIKKSTRKGIKGFEKTYEGTPKNFKITALQNGIKKTYLPQEMANKARHSQIAFYNLVKRQYELSPEEFEKQAGSIKHKNKKQASYIEEILSEKKRAIVHQQKSIELKDITAKIKKIKNKSNRSFEDEIRIQELLVQQARAELEVERLSYSPSKYKIEQLKRKLELAKNDLAQAKQYYQIVPFDIPKQETLRKPVQYITETYTDISPENKHLYTKNTADYQFYIQNRNLTPDSNINLFEGFDKKPYDIPERFAIMTDNAVRKQGNAYIIESVPEIFKGIDKKEIMDTLSIFARSKKDKVGYTINIGGKRINIIKIGGGEVGNVYKLTDEKGNTAALKIFSTARGYSLDVNSSMTEIPTSRQLTKDKVVDVPKFYMANGALTKRVNDETYQDVPWMLSEFIEDDKIPDEGKKLSEWLQEHFMYHGDIAKNGRTNGSYVLDIGGIVSNNLQEGRQDFGIAGLDGCNKNNLNNLLEKALKTGMGVEDIIKIFE